MNQSTIRLLNSFGVPTLTILVDEVRTNRKVMDMEIGFCCVCGTQVKGFRSKDQKCPICGEFQLVIAEDMHDRFIEMKEILKEPVSNKRKPKRFTPEEDKFILENDRLLTQREIGKKLSRFAGGIHDRLKYLRGKK